MHTPPHGLSVDLVRVDLSDSGASAEGEPWASVWNLPHTLRPNWSGGTG